MGALPLDPSFVIVGILTGEDSLVLLHILKFYRYFSIFFFKADWNIHAPVVLFLSKLNNASKVEQEEIKLKSKQTLEQLTSAVIF